MHTQEVDEYDTDEKIEIILADDEFVQEDNIDNDIKYMLNNNKIKEVIKDPIIVEYSEIDDHSIFNKCKVIQFKLNINGKKEKVKNRNNDKDI